MPATTAQLMLGNPHPNDGGLTPIDTMTFIEGSRPAWILRRTGPLRSGGSREVVWIPTLEHIIDDALLMAAIHAFKSEPIRDKFRSFSDKIDDGRLQLYEDLSVEQRHELYRLCRGLDDFPKVVLTVYADSALIPRIGALAHYRMECEVLMPVYTRRYSRWTRQTTTEGELPPVPEFIDHRPPPIPEELKSWFHRLTGIAETSYEATRSQLRVEGDRLHSLANGRSWQIGRLETPSLDELRERARPALAANRGRLTVRNIEASAYGLHAQPEAAGALVQVASQFNLLQVPNYRVTPEVGVGGYEKDHGQGPACARAAGAAAIYRNYCASVGEQSGQTRDRQIDTLADLRAALPGGEGISMCNGYARAGRMTLQMIQAALEAASAEEIDALRARLRIGLHHDVEVTVPGAPPGQCVNQACCSALPVGYNINRDPKLWQPLARLVLEAAYEATLLAGVINAARAGGSRSVYLTLLGAAALNNQRTWILDAIRRALDLVRDQALDVYIVSLGGVHPDLQTLVRDYDHNPQD